MEKKDIFDKIMLIPGLRILNPFYRKNKEVLLYLFFGGLAMFVSIVSYWLCSELLGIGVLVSNLISWVAAVLFAYTTNRVWVFDQKTNGIKELIAQILRFFSGRVFTLIVEEVILWVFIELLSFGNMAVKIVAQIVVIVLNYVISKFFVFKKGSVK